jgi:transketolase
VTEATWQYGDVLWEAGAQEERIVVVDAGLATSMSTARFARAFPSRYFNLGIAEQNAVGVASGLARRGLIPLVHTFSNFLVRRAHDQVALSVVWPGCNVTLVGGSCGLFDGRNGPSHFAGDDLAVMAALPGQVLVAEPADQRQTRELLFAAVRHPGPSYLRLRRNGMARDLLPGFDDVVGTVPVERHDDAAGTLVIGGSMLDEGRVAARILADRGTPVDVVHVSVLRPFASGPVIESVRRTRRVFTVENHVACGGYGDAVARAVGPLAVAQFRLALPDRPLPAGDPATLLTLSGLHAAGIADTVSTFLLESAHV